MFYTSNNNSLNEQILKNDKRDIKLKNFYQDLNKTIFLNIYY
jgi:hypothetical protein